MARSMEQAPTWTKLSALWSSSAIPTLPTTGHRYAIFSDLHLGDGGRADDFALNELHLLYALDHYLQEGYEPILLGDTEEFWQFDLPAIVRRYGETVYAALRCFGNERIHRVYGNHDVEWGGFVDPARYHAQQPSLAPEALRLQGPDGRTTLLLVHGHQGSLQGGASTLGSADFLYISSKG